MAHDHILEGKSYTDDAIPNWPLLILLGSHENPSPLRLEEQQSLHALAGEPPS